MFGVSVRVVIVIFSRLLLFTSRVTAHLHLLRVTCHTLRQHHMDLGEEGGGGISELYAREYVISMHVDDYLQQS